MRAYSSNEFWETSHSYQTFGTASQLYASQKSETREGEANPKALQPRTRELLYRWRDMQEVSHQRQHRMGACTEVLYPLTTNRQLCLYPQRRNR